MLLEVSPKPSNKLAPSVFSVPSGLLASYLLHSLLITVIHAFLYKAWRPFSCFWHTFHRTFGYSVMQPNRAAAISKVSLCFSNQDSSSCLECLLLPSFVTLAFTSQDWAEIPSSAWRVPSPLDNGFIPIPCLQFDHKLHEIMNHILFLSLPLLFSPWRLWLPCNWCSKCLWNE